MLCSYRPKKKREWQGVLGLDYESFTNLVELCKQSYIELHSISFEDDLPHNSKNLNIKIRTVEELIFYTLSILKSGITFDFAAFLMQFDQSRAHRQFKKGVELLHFTLDQQAILPIRSFENPKEFEAYFTDDQVLIFDGTEQRIQRPQDREYQKEAYSGKKKTHTIKAMIISTLDRYVHYVSPAYVGKTHDFALLKSEFEPSQNWFNGYHIRLDLGFYGFEKEYPLAKIHIPNKKPRKSQLNEKQKEENKKLASERISVEHSIGGIKRYDILSTPARIHDVDLYDKVLATCTGLWNFMITN